VVRAWIAHKCLEICEQSTIANNKSQMAKGGPSAICYFLVVICYPEYLTISAESL